MRTSEDFRAFRFMLLFFVMGTCFFSVKLASAGVNPPIGDLSSSDPQTSQDPKEQSSATPSTEAKPERNSETNEEKKKEKEKKSDHAGSFVIAPLPIVSPALGPGIIPVAGYITPISATDRKVEPSVVGAGGLITNNGSREFGLGADLYLDKARYEVTSAYAHGSLDYNLYGVGFVNGNAGFKLPLEQTVPIFFVKFLRRIPWEIYAGGRFMTGSSFLTLK